LVELLESSIWPNILVLLLKEVVKIGFEVDPFRYAKFYRVSAMGGAERRRLVDRAVIKEGAVKTGLKIDPLRYAKVC
jgi:hypothetical protein